MCDVELSVVMWTVYQYSRNLLFAKLLTIDSYSFVHCYIQKHILRRPGAQYF